MQDASPTPERTTTSRAGRDDPAAGRRVRPSGGDSPTTGAPWSGLALAVLLMLPVAAVAPASRLVREVLVTGGVVLGFTVAVLGTVVLTDGLLRRGSAHRSGLFKWIALVALLTTTAGTACTAWTPVNELPPGPVFARVTLEDGERVEIDDGRVFRNGDDSVLQGRLMGTQRQLAIPLDQAVSLEVGRFSVLRSATLVAVGSAVLVGVGALLVEWALSTDDGTPWL